MNFLTWNPFRKLHPAAFSGTAICPFCYGTKVKNLERLGPYVIRMQCKTCHAWFREDNAPLGRESDNPNDKRHWVGSNPYASFKNGLRPGMQVRRHHYSKKPKPA